ncbi:MAG: Asp-tRNA(Asn)/Glu-tRNA(Gln) amidotransferase GatCAB subunit B, partial [Roseovarius gahaiensis]
FEDSVAGGDGKRTANWIINEVLGRANKAEVPPRQIAAPDVNAAIMAMVGKDEISSKMAKDVLEIHIETGDAPDKIVDERGMKQVSDTGAIEAAVDQIIADNPAQVEKAKVNPKLAGWFVGQVMKATGGKANPKAVNQIVAQKLGL